MAGIDALPRSARAALVFLADQAALGPADLALLAAVSRARPARDRRDPRRGRARSAGGAAAQPVPGRAAAAWRSGRARAAAQSRAAGGRRRIAACRPRRGSAGGLERAQAAASARPKSSIRRIVSAHVVPGRLVGHDAQAQRIDAAQPRGRDHRRAGLDHAGLDGLVQPCRSARASSLCPAAGSGSTARRVKAARAARDPQWPRRARRHRSQTESCARSPRESARARKSGWTSRLSTRGSCA